MAFLRYNLSMIEVILVLLLAGLFAGFSAGLLGIGGGVVVVPALDIMLRHFGMPLTYSMHMAIGSSLGVMVITAAVSVYTHNQKRAVIWPLVFKFVPGMVLGVLIGTFMVSHLSGKTLHWIFAGFLLLSAAQLLWSVFFSTSQKNQVKNNESVQRVINISALKQGAAGSIIGFVGASLGIGGSIITVPYLNALRFPIRLAIATAAACSLAIAIVGAIAYVYAGWHVNALLPWSLGYLYLPAMLVISLSSSVAAYFGAKWAHKLPSAGLKVIFALFLILVALSFV